MITTLVHCVDLAAEMAWFRDEVGLTVHLVSPADDPERVVLHSSAGAVEIRRAEHDRPSNLVIEGEASAELTSPGGTTVYVTVPDEHPVVGAAMPVPENRPTLTFVDGSSGGFGVGRAGMEYRDLLPDRWGGRFIASHIRISDGGDVDDWVHFHRIRFQMIYVAAGWVDVVYEDQGPPFRMRAGDCVVQPPEIRHRVLRSSPGLEVVEIGCPAEHDTITDHELGLPNSAVAPDRTFSGQRFVRHVADGATCTTWVDPSMISRDTGIGGATAGLAGVVAVRPTVPAATGPPVTHDGEFVLLVGLTGSATVEFDDRAITLAPRSSVAVPGGTTWRWVDADADHEALVVEMPVGSIRLA